MPNSRITCLMAAAVAALSLAVPVSAQQRGVSSREDPSRLPESGPAVVGGTGATTGPNSKNQAVMPMPGREQELSERPADTLPLPEIRPVPGRAKPPSPSK